MAKPCALEDIAIPADLLLRARIVACVWLAVVSLGIPTAAWGIVLCELHDRPMGLAFLVVVCALALRLGFKTSSSEFQQTCNEIRARLATEQGIADECARVLGKCTTHATHTAPRPRL